MLKETIRTIAKQVIASHYPHVKLPSVVYAKVVSVQPCGTYDLEGLAITDESEGRTFQAHLTGSCYEYRLAIIDRFGNVDSDFPALPGIQSKKPFQAGSVVAVAFAYGDVDPVILGEVSL